MSTVKFRAVAILMAKAGQEEELLRYSLSALPQIREIEGLEDVELSRSVSNPSQFVLYYWWRSAEDSAAYLQSDLYAQIGPRLQSLLSDHQLAVTELQDAQ